MGWKWQRAGLSCQRSPPRDSSQLLCTEGSDEGVGSEMAVSEWRGEESDEAMKALLSYQ